MACSDMLILCIDDCQSQLNALREVLGRNGYSAHFASNGLTALAKIIQYRNACYEVVITDLDMPMIDGLVLAGILMSANYPTEFIFHSSEAPQFSRRYSNCFASYIPKGDYVQIIRRLAQIRERRGESKEQCRLA